jgi:hypothetical protein
MCLPKLFCCSMLEMYVRDGMLGRSPIRRGPPGQSENRVWAALKDAFVTYLKLEQAGSKKQSSIKDLGFNKTRDDLTRKLKKETANKFTVGKANVVEQRRLMWTTAYNLEVWFTTWSDTLIDLGFARKKTVAKEDNVEGSFFLPWKPQLHWLS